MPASAGCARPSITITGCRMRARPVTAVGPNRLVGGQLRSLAFWPAALPQMCDPKCVTPDARSQMRDPKCVTPDARSGRAIDGMAIDGMAIDGGVGNHSGVSHRALYIAGDVPAFASESRPSCCARRQKSPHRPRLCQSSCWHPDHPRLSWHNAPEPRHLPVWRSRALLPATG